MSNQTPVHAMPNAITKLIKEAAYKDVITTKAVCDAIDHYDAQITDCISASVAALSEDELRFAASLKGTGKFILDIAAAAAAAITGKETQDGNTNTLRGVPTEVSMRTAAETVSAPPSPTEPMEDNYRRGYINGAIVPGHAYVGKIINERLVATEQKGDGTDYDTWSLDFLVNIGLDPLDGNVRDVVEIRADNQKIEWVETFDPKTFLNKKVRIVLGNCVESDTWERFILKIELV